MGRGARGRGPQAPSPISAPKPSFRRFRCSAWLIHDFAPSPMRALVFRSAYSASRNARTPVASRPTASSNARPPGSLCSPSDAAPNRLFKPFRCSSRLIELPPRHPAFRRAGVPFGLLAVSAPSRLTACWRSVRLIGCAKRSNSSRFATYGKPKRSNSSRFATYGKLKRSTFRFAPLTLRLRTEMLLRNIPVFRMAYWDQRAHRAL